MLVPVVHVATITDDGHVHLYTKQADPEQAEPEQADPEQAETLTLEQRIEALEQRLSDYGLTDFISDALDYDRLADCCAERLNMREVARCVDMCDLAASIDVDLSDLAGYIDAEEIAGYIDTEDVAGNLNLTDTVRDILSSLRFRLE